MATVSVKNLTKRYGKVTALTDFSLEIPEGSLVSLLGPSGCGKTTTLRLIAGFEKPDDGEIYIGGEKVNDIPVNKRNIGVVFQSYALFPHMSVRENIAYGLQQRKLPKKETELKTAEAVELVRLSGCEDRKPGQLSGGQQQRVALARALVIRPQILLLDECLSALDKKLRVEMQAELRGILEASGITALFVTHDQEEALTLSDYIVVMNEGRAAQTGSPFEVYERPRSRFVAGFLGKANFFEGRVTGASEQCVQLDTEEGQILLPAEKCPEKGTEAIFSIRPEKIKLSGEPPGYPHLEGVIEFITYAGNITTYTLNCGGKTVLAEEQNAARSAKFRTGATIYIHWEHEHCLLMEE